MLPYCLVLCLLGWEFIPGLFRLCLFIYYFFSWSSIRKCHSSLVTSTVLVYTYTAWQVSMRHSLPTQPPILHACSITKSCLAFYNPVDCSLLSFSVHRICQARILERITLFSSRRSSQMIFQPSSNFQPRNWNSISWVSYIGKWILYHWVTWEAQPLFFFTLALLQYNLKINIVCI